MLPAEDRPVYHFTHVRNLPSVLDQGYAHCDRIVREDRSLRIECGDRDIKERRRSRKVDLPPGGVVADYVPFYFAPRSPMLYKINKGAVPTYTLTAEVDALVNTVNTVGVMGKGIALQFKRAYPDNFATYERGCAAGEVQLGRMHVHDRGTLTKPRYVINFPTKGHWRSRSRLEDVREGLQDLRRVIVELKIHDIAVPPLGCGNGGLPWDDVHPLITAALGDLPDVEVRVYPPQGAPPASAMPNNQVPPALNRERAAFLVALDRYIKRGLAGGFIIERQTTLLEVHKLVYLLQHVGFDFGLRFTKGHYGPYSFALDGAVAALEGHFVSGYGDGTRGSSAPLSPVPEAVARAADFLGADAEFGAAIQRLDRLVDGYEHAYGMELLGTLLFASEELAPGQVAFSTVAEYVKEWTPRKQRMFTNTHLSAAWERLTNCSLTPSPV